MEKFPPTEAAPVWIINGDPETVKQIEEIAHIVGVKTATANTSIPDSARLIISTGKATPPQFPPCPRVHIGTQGDLELPRDANLLVELLGQIEAHSMQTVLGPLPTIIIAGWHGGAGTTRVTCKLAKVSGAVLLDASGAPRADFDAEILNWSQIDPRDPPLPTELQAKLPRRNGIRLLSPAGVDAPRPTDPRVLAVASSSKTHLVIDAGQWEIGLLRFQHDLRNACRKSKLILVGKGQTKASSLAAILACEPNSIDCLLTSTRASTEMTLICEKWKIKRQRVPKYKWKELWGSLAHG